jgi:hypothetical protein
VGFSLPFPKAEIPKMATATNVAHRNLNLRVSDLHPSPSRTRSSDGMIGGCCELLVLLFNKESGGGAGGA